jgi:8-oxo-dGTP pyrophosphatase MutT (NUDIX family)
MSSDTPAIARATALGDAAALLAHLRARLAVAATEQAISTAASAANATRGFPHPLPPRLAAVLAPIYALESRPHLLFTVRSLDMASHRGEISFPGGSRDPGDPDLAATALREADEELGIAPGGVELLGALPLVFAGPSNFAVTPFVGWLGEGVPALTPNPTEVAEVIYAPLSALADPAIYHTEVWQRFGQQHLVHFYDFGPYRIWGATGRMLHTLLALLPPQ